MDTVSEQSFENALDKIRELSNQNAAMMKALMKASNYLGSGCKIKPDSRIHDCIKKALRKAKGD